MKTGTKGLPRLVLWLLTIVVKSHDRHYATGDFAEIYRRTARDRNTFIAQCWLWFEILRSLPGFARSTVYWSFVMFKNYLTVAFRNMRKHKGYTFINITGLAIGIACCLLISLWVLDELSYDRFHANAGRIFNVRASEYSTSTPNALGPSLERMIPEIQYATRFSWIDQSLVASGADTSFEWIAAVDPSFFNMFAFPFVKGNAAAALTGINSIVIAEDVAEKFFPNQDAVGQILALNNSTDFIVTGVIKNIPHNSTLQFDMLVPLEYKIQSYQERNEVWDRWSSWGTATYVKVHQGCTIKDLNKKVHDFYQEQTGWDNEIRLFGVSLQNLHLYDSRIRTYIYTFSTIAAVVLIMACLNFVNLTIARSANKAKETGVRKLTGAHRTNLIGQFLMESALQSMLGFVLALGLVEVILPMFNDITGLQLSRDLLFSSSTLALIAVLALLTGLAAGAYPALYLSSFQPAVVLKGALRSASGGSTLRRCLVVVQFSAAVFLLIGTSVVYGQLGYFNNADIGFDRDHVVNIPMRGETSRQYDRLKNGLLQNPKIQSMTASRSKFPNWSSGGDAIDWPGKDPDSRPRITLNWVDHDLIETFGIEMVEGRDFDPLMASDSASGYLINQTMGRLMGLQSAEGAELSVWGKPGTVIGVMKDFHFQPFDRQIQPLVILLDPGRITTACIRIHPDDVGSTLDYVRETWSSIFPSYPFVYTFLDDQLEAPYQRIERMGDLAGGFTLLAIVIACLGLFGLASFMAERRTREIGIRKVLGASVAGVVRLLSREFLILVMVANIIAWPVAWYVMKRWLENFAYHVDIGAGVFLLVGVTTLVIAVLTVSYQAIRAARINPVDALKHE
ncbi:MAG: ABC transporter permease [Candidatus Zixiibacteriota bacterium]|nr:MAG: ABC transporter permease [candidate division Zixibacteria bacterium]